MSSSSLYLFGPQESNLPTEILQDISQRLNNDADLAPLRSIISLLPQHWSETERSNSDIFSRETSQQLDALCQLLQQDRVPELKNRRCVFDNCLTVILHAIHLLDLDKQSHHSIIDRETTHGQQSFQGFCIGLLSAVAAASASSRSNYFECSRQALFLAVHIGSIVDKDEEDQLDARHLSKSFSLRWKSSVSKADIDSLIESFPKVCHVLIPQLSAALSNFEKCTDLHILCD
jgi:hypothetical protein